MIMTLSSINVLGARVHAVQMPEALRMLEGWIEADDRCHYVVATGMHGVMEAQKHQDFMVILNSADLFIPDGMSLVWYSRLRGQSLRKRVTAADLMSEFLTVSEAKGYKNFFYGDTDDTLRLLDQRLKEKFPRLNIAGFYSPPFRPSDAEEETREIQLLNESGADVVWVGLGLPKQERWMFRHKDELTVPVVVGVGASFKFLSGQVQRAPSWVGDNGMEWLWRFIQEPRRLWRRVLLDGPRFVFQVLLDLSGLKKNE